MKQNQSQNEEDGRTLEWRTEQRKLSDLKPADVNPREASARAVKDLRKSLNKFGLAAPLIINTDNTIIGGHLRTSILEEEYVDVRVPSRELSKEEVRELNLRLNKNTGKFDFDILANNFELPELKEVGFTEIELGLDTITEPVKRPAKVRKCPSCGYEY